MTTSSRVCELSTPLTHQYWSRLLLYEYLLGICFPRGLSDDVRTPPVCCTCLGQTGVSAYLYARLCNFGTFFEIPLCRRVKRQTLRLLIVSGYIQNVPVRQHEIQKAVDFFCASSPRPRINLSINGSMRWVRYAQFPEGWITAICSFGRIAPSLIAYNPGLEWACATRRRWRATAVRVSATRLWTYWHARSSSLHPTHGRYVKNLTHIVCDRRFGRQESASPVYAMIHAEFG